MEVSNATCSYPSLPGVEIPDDYISRATPGAFGPYKVWFNSRNVTRDYNLQVNQAVPFAAVAAFPASESNGGSVWQPEVQIVCVTPNNTQQGSRVPESRTPWTSDAGAKWRPVEGLSMIFTGVVGLILAL